MTYTVYILKSKKDGGRYIGTTSNLIKRIWGHNAGTNKSTQYRRPLHVIYKKEFTDKKSALQYERWLKKQKGGFKVKELIREYNNDASIA